MKITCVDSNGLFYVMDDSPSESGFPTVAARPDYYCWHFDLDGIVCPIDRFFAFWDESDSFWDYLTVLEELDAREELARLRLLLSK